MTVFARTIAVLDNTLRWAAALCLLAMFALVLMQVLLRYTGAGIPVFTEEVARYAMIWSTLLAAAVAVREASHIRISLLPDFLAHSWPVAERATRFVLDSITLGIVLVLFWQGIEMVTFAAGQRSDGLRISLSYPYAAVPVSFLFATLFAAARLLSGEADE